MSQSLRIIIKGAGEMASGIALRLHRAGFQRILLLECAAPTSVRRAVSFSEAVYDGVQTVEGVQASRVELGDTATISRLWAAEQIAVTVDEEWKSIAALQPAVVVDAVLAKKNLGTHIAEAPMVIAVGPGFVAGQDAHAVVESQRGHNLGRVYWEGSAEPNTGIPGNIGGHTLARVLRAPRVGVVREHKAIGEMVCAGEAVCSVDAEMVIAAIDGVVRGSIRPGIAVEKGTKLGDVDPRGMREYCFTVSEKARTLGGAVLEVVSGFYWQRREKV